MSSSDPHSNDESVSSGSEKLYYVPAECSELHDGRVLLNHIYSINIDVLFNLIFTKSEFMLDFLKSRNFQNVEIGDWLDKSSILKNDRQPPSSSNTRSSQTTSPRQSGSSSPTRRSSQSSIKRPSKLFLSRATQTNNESTSDEDNKNDLVRVKSVILNTKDKAKEDTKNDLVIVKSTVVVNDEDNAKKDIKNNLVIVKSSFILNNENNAVQEIKKEEIQKENNKEKSIKENNKKQSIKEKNIKDEQNKKNNSSEDDENSNIRKTKTLQYTVNSSIGSNVRVTNELVLLKCSIPNELYSINESSTSKGVLYADAFTIDIHYCLVRVSAEKTKLLIYGNVKFVKNLISFTKSIIESQVWNGLNDYYKQLNIQLQEFSSHKPLKRQTFSFSSMRRKLSTSSRRAVRVRTPDSSYETADDDDERGSSAMMGITKSFNALKRKIIKLKTKKTCASEDTSEDCDEILVNDNINNNDEDDYFRKIWNDYFTTNIGLGILIVIGLTVICFLRR